LRTSSRTEYFHILLQADQPVNLKTATPANLEPKVTEQWLAILLHTLGVLDSNLRLSISVVLPCRIRELHW